MMNMTLHQSASQVWMMRPAHFGYNPETARSNSFQNERKEDCLRAIVLKEFDAVVSVLKNAGVDIMVLKDRKEIICPDAIFLNNWFSTHADGTICIYPMESLSRRLEIRMDIINSFAIEYSTSRIINYTQSNCMSYMEGTGSLVLDRQNKIVYACLSSRTDRKMIARFCSEMKYESVIFEAFDSNSEPLYHTNVMMSIASAYVLICSDCISVKYRNLVLDSLYSSGRSVIDVEMDQMKAFLPNCLEVRTKQNEKLLIISSSAASVLSKIQQERISEYARVVVCDVPTIESIGGGSIRCMMAECFLQKK